MSDWRDDEWYRDYFDALCALCSSDEFRKIQPPIKSAMEYFKSQYIGMGANYYCDKPTARELQFYRDQAQREIHKTFAIPRDMLVSRKTILERKLRAEQIRKLISDTNPDPR